VAAGALNTPKVLIESGIGPSELIDLLSSLGTFPGVDKANAVINEHVGRHIFDTNAVMTNFKHADMHSFKFTEPQPEAEDQ